MVGKRQDLTALDIEERRQEFNLGQDGTWRTSPVLPDAFRNRDACDLRGVEA